VFVGVLTNQNHHHHFNNRENGTKMNWEEFVSEYKKLNCISSFEINELKERTYNFRINQNFFSRDYIDGDDDFDWLILQQTQCLYYFNNPLEREKNRK